MKPRTQALLITTAIISIIIILIYFNGKKRDFTKVQVGMTYEQLENTVGKPDKSEYFVFGVKLLMYDEGYIIAFENEKIVNVMTREQFVKGMESVFENMERARNGIKEWEVKKKEIDKKMIDFQRSLN